MRKAVFYLCSVISFLTHGQGNAGLAEKHYEEGLRMYRSGDYQASLKELNRSLYLDATRIDAYLLRADVWEKANRKENALTDVETALLLQPDSRELTFRKGLLLFQLSRWEDALSTFQRVLRLPAGETHNLYYMQLPYRETTVAMLTTQSDIRSLIYTYLGLAAIQLNKCRDAIAWFDSAMLITKNSADLLVNRARAWADCGEPASAQSDLQQALQIDPGHALALHHLARLSGNDQQMEEQLTEVIRTDSLLPDAWLERANYRLGRNDYAGAEHDYSRALTYLFNNPEIWLNRGIARKHLNNWAGAYDDFSMALYLEEDFVKAWLERGNVLHQLKRFYESIEDYTAALSYDPDNPRAYFNRGLSWSKLEKWENACSDFLKAEQLQMTIPESLKKRCKKTDY